MKRWMCVQCTWRWFHVSLSLSLYISFASFAPHFISSIISISGMCEIIGVEQTQNLFYIHTSISQNICTLDNLLAFFHTLHFVCWFLFYRSRQAHKLSNLNWIPFILMFHYQTIRFDAIEQIVKQEKEPRERNEKKNSPNIVCVFSHFIIMCLHSLHFARHQMNKHNDWDARVPFLRC